MKRILSLSLFILACGTLAAQESQPATAGSGTGDFYTEALILAVVFTALVILAASLAMLKAFRVIFREMANPQPFKDPAIIEAPQNYEIWKEEQKSKPGIWTRILGLKPLSEEKDIMLEHKFDGISELDNPTPAWFMWLFYSTIVFAVVYLMYYHVLAIGPLQDEEYATEMAAAQADREVYLATSGNNIDENTVEVSVDAEIISSGSALYTLNCVACHGDKGQGTVGPNLTDEYWLHGGSVHNIFKTIKYGVPEKGMISWEKTLSPKQISDLSNFILSLKGTHPPNPKDPQGVKEE